MVVLAGRLDLNTLHRAVGPIEILTGRLQQKHQRILEAELTTATTGQLSCSFARTDHHIGLHTCFQTHHQGWLGCQSVAVAVVVSDGRLGLRQRAAMAAWVGQPAQ